MTEADRRNELIEVEAELEGVRASVAALRREVGGRSEGAVDPEDTAALVRSADEQETLAVALEARRDAIKRLLESS